MKYMRTTSAQTPAVMYGVTVRVGGERDKECLYVARGDFTSLLVRVPRGYPDLDEVLL